MPPDDQSWIDALPEHVKHDVINAMAPLHLNKGEHIYSQGDESLSLYRVESGQVIISNISTSGKELIIGLIESGNCFGELGLIDGLPRANNAYTQAETQLQVLSKSDFWQLRTLHTEIADQLLLFVNHRLRLSFNELENLSLSSLPQQLARRLHGFALRYSTPSPEGQLITIKLSREDLGKTLGVSRQSIHKTIKILLEADLLLVKNGRFIIPNMEQLKAFANQ